MSDKPRYVRKPEGSNWGEFGLDDQIGRLNYIGSEKILEGIAEVKVGKSFCLSLPLNRPGKSVLAAARWPPRIYPTTVGKRGQIPLMNFYNKNTPDVHDVLSDDYVMLCLQYSTQWDAFCHSGQLFDLDGDGHTVPSYYNGYRGGTDIVELSPETDPAPNMGGAHKLGIENMAQSCVQGRGVLIDLHAHFGNARKAVGYEDLMRVMEKDSVEVAKGDMVLFRTGFSQLIYEMGENPDGDVLRSSCTGLNGEDPKLLDWITSSGLSIIATDNFAVELLAAAGEERVVHDCTRTPLHRHCLFNLGIHLGEMWYLTELADWLRANKRNRFLLTAPPLRLPGAVGSPATPIATV
jgi:kynurenine formamidase